jgi:lipopolysaccharide/colanic/teichoic acid biosynthesis glycosyltransferase/glycosyltransferase involved in cell wall biosynthesis
VSGGSPMRVLFVTQYFPPETGAAPARALHFAQALERAGHQVRVVTGLPNHPAGVVHPEYRGVRHARERLGGIEIERVWLHASPRKTTQTRLLNHLTFAVSALGAALARPRADMVFASIPPLFLGGTAWLAARRHGAPLVLDCRDDWPAAAVALGEMRPGLAAAMLEAYARFLQRRADRVLAVTPGMLRAFERAGLDAGRLVLITNGADTDLFRPAPPPPAGAAAGAGVTVLYSGTHGLIHGMDVLIDAAERLRDRADVRFRLIGDGVSKPALVERARAMGLGNIEFRPSVPPAQLVGEIGAADLCVATTRDHPFCGETIPVKLFDYLACGRPVVAAVSGDAARVIEESGGGVVVPPGDGGALAAVIAELAGDPARRARLGAAGPAFVEARYSRRAVGARLVEVLGDVLRLARGRDVAPLPAGLAGAARRAADVVVSGGLLLLLSPLLLLIALAIRLDSPGPALFRQRRAGRASREFSIFKFRTMQVGTPDLASHLVGPGSQRVTRVGRLLRRTSLDELPQLLNVLTGSMALVGPRPALHNQEDLIALRQQAGVDALKPGVTGWAQIHGRDDIPLDQKVAYDRWYLEHLSPWLDLWIVLRTPFVLFSSRGVY